MGEARTITLLIGTSLLAGMGFGWYGHKAKLRIDIWGKNEQEQDLVFQVAEGGQELREQLEADAWRRVSAGAVYGRSHESLSRPIAGDFCFCGSRVARSREQR